MNEHNSVECIVAAILAGAAVGTEPRAPDRMVTKYREILKELRATGGPIPAENEGRK